MATREEMLGRIRMALAQSLGRPNRRFWLDSGGLPEIGDVMPPVGAGEIISKFVSEFEKASTRAWRADSMAALDTILADLMRGRLSGPAVISRNPLLMRLNVAERLRKLGVQVFAWPEAEVSPDVEQTFRDCCFAASVGITGVDWALAETGSLVTSSLTEGAQLASLAPPVHVAMVRESQVIAKLEDALAGLRVSREALSPSPGRSAVFITGSSRTADIEQMVVRGVHGPHEVHAILIDDACLE